MTVEDSIPINDGWTRDWGPTVRPVIPDRHELRILDGRIARPPCCSKFA